jgi:hypothetical protein
MKKLLYLLLFVIPSLQCEEIKTIDGMRGTFYFPILDDIKIGKLQGEAGALGGTTTACYEGDGHDIKLKIWKYAEISKEEFKVLIKEASEKEKKSFELAGAVVLDYSVDKDTYRTGTAGTLVCRDAKVTFLTESFFVEIKVTDYIGEKADVSTSEILNRIILNVNKILGSKNE